MDRPAFLLGLVLATALVTGCTHSQLRYNTVKQAETISDLYQQQVLNNLAMFVYEPNSLPHFAFPNAGASHVTDRGSLSGGLDWSRGVKSFFLNAARISGSADRQSHEAWTLAPIADPHKLALMRCAYQKAVASCLVRTDGSSLVSQACPDCTDRWRDFYAGHAHGENECCIGGECCWFGFGSKDDIPDCDCLLVGEYCDLSVWVLPGQRDRLTRLTLEILDYALYSPAPPLVITKQVTLYLSADDQPATAATANRVVVAEIPIDEPNSAILVEPAIAAQEELEALRQEHRRLSEVLASPIAPDKRVCVERRLFELQDEINRADKKHRELAVPPPPDGDDPSRAPLRTRRPASTSGLRTKFLPKLRTPPPVSGGILELEQRLRALTDQP